MKKKKFCIFVFLSSLLITALVGLWPSGTAFAQESYTYTVSKDDCLWTIANKFGVTVEAIMSTNGLVSDFLQVGQTLTIPGNNATSAAVENNATSTFIYTVAQGDCLWSIANKFGTTVEAILAANNLDSDFLQLGQDLAIPGENTPSDNQTKTDIHNNYVVSQGDCLWTIANKFGTTVELIKAANRLDSDELHIGQALTIPKITASSNQPVSRGASNRISAKKAAVGELVSWPIVDELFPRGSTAILQDYRTGRQFKIYRLFGGNHADCEPLTAEDSAIMKACFGGQWSWDRRPAILIINGRAIAASMAGMPHGTSQDIYGNDFDGMFDLHFLNSRTHGTDRIDPAHQAAVREAAGL